MLLIRVLLLSFLVAYSHRMKATSIAWILVISSSCLYRAVLNTKENFYFHCEWILNRKSGKGDGGKYIGNSTLQ